MLNKCWLNGKICIFFSTLLSQSFRKSAHANTVRCQSRSLEEQWLCPESCSGIEFCLQYQPCGLGRVSLHSWCLSTLGVSECPICGMEREIRASVCLTSWFLQRSGWSNPPNVKSLVPSAVILVFLHSAVLCSLSSLSSPSPPLLMFTEHLLCTRPRTFTHFNLNDSWRSVLTLSSTH